MKLIWEYCVPLSLALLAAITYFGDPNERILFAIPIVPGENKNLYAIAFLIASIFFAYSIFRSRSKDGRGN